MLIESLYTIGTLTLNEPGYTFKPVNVPNLQNYQVSGVLLGNNGTKVYGLLINLGPLDGLYFYYSANDDTVTFYSYPFISLPNALVLGSFEVSLT